METYRNPVRREDLGTGGDRKKVVPESSTQGESGNRQRSEESCTGIRYAKQHRIASGIEKMTYQILIKNMKHVLKIIDFMGERAL